MVARMAETLKDEEGSRVQATGVYNISFTYGLRETLSPRERSRSKRVLSSYLPNHRAGELCNQILVVPRDL